MPGAAEHRHPPKLEVIVGERRQAVPPKSASVEAVPTQQRLALPSPSTWTTLRSPDPQDPYRNLPNLVFTIMTDNED